MHEKPADMSSKFMSMFNQFYDPRKDTKPLYVPTILLQKPELSLDDF